MTKRIGLRILVKIGKTKKVIATNEKITATFLEFLIPILIANVFTPWFLSPSMSSHPLITSLATKRENAVRKKKRMYGGIFELFKNAPYTNPIENETPTITFPKKPLLFPHFAYTQVINPKKIANAKFIKTNLKMRVFTRLRTIQTIRDRKNSLLACFKLIEPLGIGRFGLFILSISIS